MAQLKNWFDDYNSYHPHSALVLLAANAVQGEAIGNLNLPAVLEYRVKTNKASGYKFHFGINDMFFKNLNAQ